MKSNERVCPAFLVLSALGVAATLGCHSLPTSALPPMPGPVTAIRRQSEAHATVVESRVYSFDLTLETNQAHVFTQGAAIVAAFPYGSIECSDDLITWQLLPQGPLYFVDLAPTNHLFFRFH